MVPRDRGRKRKVALSGPKVRPDHRRPSGLDGGSPLACRPQACPAGEPWHHFVGSGCHAGNNVLSYGRTRLERATGRLRCLLGSNGGWTLKVTRNSRRPTKVGPRDRKVARVRALCIGMSAGMMRIATMVEEPPNSTLDERHLHRGWPVDGKTRSLRQAVVVKEKDVETSDRGCRSTTGTHCARVLSVGMRSGRLRIQ